MILRSALGERGCEVAFVAEEVEEELAEIGGICVVLKEPVDIFGAGKERVRGLLLDGDVDDFVL